MESFLSSISKSLQPIWNRISPNHVNQSDNTSHPTQRIPKGCVRHHPTGRLYHKVIQSSTPTISPNISHHEESLAYDVESSAHEVEEVKGGSYSKACPSSQDLSNAIFSPDDQLQEFCSSINCLEGIRVQADYLTDPPPLHTDLDQSSLVASINWDPDISFDDSPIDWSLILDTSFDDSDIDWDVDIAYDESPIDWDLDVSFDDISAVHNMDISYNKGPIDWYLDTSSYEVKEVQHTTHFTKEVCQQSMTTNEDCKVVFSNIPIGKHLSGSLVQPSEECTYSSGTHSSVLVKKFIKIPVDSDINLKQEIQEFKMLNDIVCMTRQLKKPQCHTVRYNKYVQSLGTFSTSLLLQELKVPPDKGFQSPFKDIFGSPVSLFISSGHIVSDHISDHQQLFKTDTQCLAPNASPLGMNTLCCERRAKGEASGHNLPAYKALVPNSKLREICDEDNIVDTMNYRGLECSDCLNCKQSSRNRAILMQYAREHVAIDRSIEIKLSTQELWVGLPFFLDLIKFLSKRREHARNSPRRLCWACLKPYASCQWKCAQNTRIPEVIKCVGCVEAARGKDFPPMTVLYCFNPDHEPRKPQPAELFKELKKYLKGMAPTISENTIIFSNLSIVPSSSIPKSLDQQSPKLSKTKAVDPEALIPVFESCSGDRVGGESQSSHMPLHDACLLLQIVKIGKSQCLLMFDRGANINLIDGDIAEQEDLCVLSQNPTTISGAGGNRISSGYGKYMLKLGSTDLGWQHLTYHGMPEVTVKFPRYDLASINHEFQRVSGINAPLPSFTGGAPVAMLIGIQNVALDPVRIGVLPSGVGVFQSPFRDIFSSNICYGGPHHTFMDANRANHFTTSAVSLFVSSCWVFSNQIMEQSELFGTDTQCQAPDTSPVGMNTSHFECEAMGEVSVQNLYTHKALIPNSKLREICDEDDCADTVNYRCPDCSDCQNRVTKIKPITLNDIVLDSPWQKGLPWMQLPTGELHLTSFSKVEANLQTWKEISQEGHTNPFFLEPACAPHPLLVESFPPPESESSSNNILATIGTKSTRPSFFINIMALGWFCARRVISLLKLGRRWKHNTIHQTLGESKTPLTACLKCENAAIKELHAVEQEVDEILFRHESSIIRKTFSNKKLEQFIKDSGILYYRGRINNNNIFTQVDLDSVPFLDASECLGSRPVVLADSVIFFAYLIAVHMIITPHTGNAATACQIAKLMFIPSKVSCLIQKIRNDFTKYQLIIKRTVEVEMKKHHFARAMIAPVLYNSMMDIAYGFPGQAYLNARKRVDVYALVIVCILSGATNILALESLETQSVVQALERHSSQHGVPAHIFVDNGIQLKALNTANFKIQDLNTHVFETMGMKVLVSNAKAHEERGRVVNASSWSVTVEYFVNTSKASKLSPRTVVRNPREVAILFPTRDPFPNSTEYFCAYTKGISDREIEYHNVEPVVLVVPTRKENELDVGECQPPPKKKCKGKRGVGTSNTKGTSNSVPGEMEWFGVDDQPPILEDGQPLILDNSISNFDLMGPLKLNNGSFGGGWSLVPPPGQCCDDLLLSQVRHTKIRAGGEYCRGSMPSCTFKCIPIVSN